MPKTDPRIHTKPKLKTNPIQLSEVNTVAFVFRYSLLPLTSRLLVGLTVLTCLLANSDDATSQQRRFSEQRIRFARGTHSQTVRGEVSRNAARLFLVGAKAGQNMTVKLDGDAKTRFDLSGPRDTSGQKMASGETEWAGSLPDDGDYKIFVFTEGKAIAPFVLRVSVE